MKPTQTLQSGAHVPVGKYGHYLGYWGDMGGQPQKGIIHYGLAPNRQNPFAGAAHDAVFNVWRRTSGQLLFWLPPILIGYYSMEWAVHRNHYLYSKAGRAEMGESEE